MSELRSQTMTNLATAVTHIRQKLPSITLVATDSFRWDPANRQLHYIDDHSQPTSTIMLLHEAGHALSNHNFFKNDLDLLTKEVEAWSKARIIAADMGMKIDEAIIEDCLDSYRHWLDKRSTCPECRATGYQDADNCYQCFNCMSRWLVGTDQATRVCRITAE